MNHIVCFPSADPAIGIACANAWMAKGYSVLMMIDWGAIIDHRELRIPADIQVFHAYTAPGKFKGYYREINGIVAKAFGMGADLVTCIGDDMFPPHQGAQFVAEEYFKRFPDGFGILQATGDCQGADSSGRAASERIAGSPCFGKGWNERAFQGKGPFGEFGFVSFYMDEALRIVAERLGVMCDRVDMTIMHKHWSFGHGNIQEWNLRAQKNWEHDQKLFMSLQSVDFAL